MNIDFSFWLDIIILKSFVLGMIQYLFMYKVLKNFIRERIIFFLFGKELSAQRYQVRKK